MYKILVHHLMNNYIANTYVATTQIKKKNMNGYQDPTVASTQANLFPPHFLVETMALTFVFI